MLAVDGTFLVILFSFILFMGLMHSLFFGPVMRIKTEREGTIESDLGKSAEALEKSNRLAIEYQLKLGEAKRKAQLLVQEKRDKAKTDAAEKVKIARENAVQELDSKSARLKKTRETVYQELQPHRETLVQSIVEKLKGRQRSAAGAPNP